MLQGKELMQEIESLINVNGIGLSRELLEFIASVILLEDMSATKELKIALNYLMSMYSKNALLGGVMSNEELLEYLGTVIENHSNKNAKEQQFQEALNIVYDHLTQQGIEPLNISDDSTANIIKNTMKMRSVQDNEALQYLHTLSERIIVKSASQ